jgi:hypothetical protein
MQYLSQQVIEGAAENAFRNRKPYPWVNMQGTLTQEGFDRLHDTLPDISQFQRMVGVKRAYGQGPHDRGILHFRPGIKVAEPWEEFLAELRGEAYQSFLRRMLNLPPDKKIIMTMEWYYAWRDCSVSPHCDARRKLATHIFYFSTESEWDTQWGGQILILDDGGRFKAHSAPAFDNFKVAAALDPRGNGSLLFERTEHSWHGVRPLQCPPDTLRKLFIVTVNLPTVQVWWRRVRGKDPDGYRIN